MDSDDDEGADEEEEKEGARSGSESESSGEWVTDSDEEDVEQYVFVDKPAWWDYHSNSAWLPDGVRSTGERLMGLGGRIDIGFGILMSTSYLSVPLLARLMRSCYFLVRPCNYQLLRAAIMLINCPAV